MRGKRQIRRKVSDMDFIRKADGSLRPPEERDIGDVWAELKRVQLKEAIQHNERKVARKQRWRKLFGGVDATAKHSPDVASKTVEIKISLPEVSWSDVAGRFRKLSAKLIRNKLSRKQWRAVVGCIVLLALFVGGFGLYGDSPDQKKKNDTTVALGVLGTGQSQEQAPAYRTLLPAGKSIEDLGGWFRVSPQEKDPVFAYRDKLGDIPISVSQQPLPDDFKRDTTNKVAKLAEQSSANETIVAGDAIAYIGTSSQGPQSVILAKSELLILVKSDRGIPNEQWEEYLAALQ